jgi:hypothetical protein
MPRGDPSDPTSRLQTGLKLRKALLIVGDFTKAGGQNLPDTSGDTNSREPGQQTRTDMSADSTQRTSTDRGTETADEMVAGLLPTRRTRTPQLVGSVQPDPAGFPPNLVVVHLDINENSPQGGHLDLLWGLKPTVKFFTVRRLIRDLPVDQIRKVQQLITPVRTFRGHRESKAAHLPDTQLAR